MKPRPEHVTDIDHIDTVLVEECPCRRMYTPEQVVSAVTGWMLSSRMTAEDPQAVIDDADIGLKSFLEASK